MAVPPTVRGDSLVTSPPGGMWNSSKRSVLWCVSELGVGEKFQLQAQFKMVEREVEEKLIFPVVVRCQCMYADPGKNKLVKNNCNIIAPIIYCYLFQITDKYWSDLEVLQ